MEKPHGAMLKSKTTRRKSGTWAKAQKEKHMQNGNGSNGVVAVEVVDGENSAGARMNVTAKENGVTFTVLPPAIEVVRVGESLQRSFLFTKEGNAWMKNPSSIPGAHSPLSYTGFRVIERIRELLGREITLDEARVLVVPDGELATCSFDGTTSFQPVKYLDYLTREQAEALKDGTPLGELKLCYNGCFYLKGPNKIVFSGSRFLHIKGGVAWAKKSPLYLAGVAKGEERQNGDSRPWWGMTRLFADDLLAEQEEHRKQEEERRERIAREDAEREARMKQFFNTGKNGKGFARGDDAFAKGAKFDERRRKGHRRDRHPYDGDHG